MDVHVIAEVSVVEIEGVIPHILPIVGSVSVEVEDVTCVVLDGAFNLIELVGCKCEV